MTKGFDLSFVADTGVAISDLLLDCDEDDIALVICATLDRLGHEFHKDVITVEDSLHSIFSTTYTMLEEQEGGD